MITTQEINQLDRLVKDLARQGHINVAGAKKLLQLLGGYSLLVVDLEKMGNKLASLKQEVESEIGKTD